MRFTFRSIMLALALAGAGCGMAGGERAVVDVDPSDEFLKLRAGPGLGFRIIAGLPDGTEVLQRDCVTEVGQLWCRVSVVDAPGLSGYVAAHYLDRD